MWIIANKVTCNYCWLEGNEFKDPVSAFEAVFLSAKNYTKHVLDYSLINIELEHSYMQHKDLQQEYFFSPCYVFFRHPELILGK